VNQSGHVDVYQAQVCSKKGVGTRFRRIRSQAHLEITQ
jgi:hypothetical protein